MKVTRQQTYDIFRTLEALSNKDMRPKGAYAISKNKKLAENEVKFIQEAQSKIKPPQGMQDFESKRIELCEKFSSKDEEGKVVTNNGKYEIPEDVREEFEKTVAGLREEYSAAFEENEEINKQFQELLNEEIEINFHKTKLEWLPEQITGKQMEILMDIIDEG